MSKRRDVVLNSLFSCECDANKAKQERHEDQYRQYRFRTSGDMAIFLEFSEGISAGGGHVPATVDDNMVSELVLEVGDGEEQGSGHGWRGEREGRERSRERES